MNPEKKKHAEDAGRLQVKVCGLTDAGEAAACAQLGVHAVGCVFYPPSPRHVSRAVARDIARSVAGRAACVGVFVDPEFEDVCRIIDFCGIDAVQLHGRETPDFVRRLRQKGVLVIKALFAGARPGLDAAPEFHPDAFLIERGGGRLPGGNAEDWRWAEAKRICTRVPMMLAGGIRPDNVLNAVRAAHPDAVDVSSGVESAPGQKDIGKVRALLQAMKQIDMKKQPRRIFP